MKQGRADKKQTQKESKNRANKKEQKNIHREEKERKAEEQHCLRSCRKRTT